MIIPKNSNFSKEIAKQFKQIFHRDMTLGGLQDLQDEINLINPVDTYLEKQVSYLEKNNAKTNVSTSGTVGQTKTKGKSFVRKIVPNETKKEEFGI